MNTSSTLTPTVDKFSALNLLTVDESSKVPKYLQVVEIIKSDIDNGIFGIGEQVPSINETSAEFYLARDTVEKAYKVLKEKGILSAVKGKGYYVASTGKICNKRCLLFLNNFNDDKMSFYRSFKGSIPESCEVDVHLFNGDPEQLERDIITNLGTYDNFIIFPHLDSVTDGLRRAISMIPKNKLIFVHREFESCQQCSAVVTDNREELYQTLAEINDNSGKYFHFRLIFPDNIYHKEIYEGFADYCLDHKIKFDIIPGLTNMEIVTGQLLIIKSDQDLAYAVRYCRDRNLELGRDVGLICYNDSALKEVLAGGISVITPDFHRIGQQVAHIVMTQDFGKSKGNYKFIRRGSV
jgi:DNA-binding transcriptional regulator YhcF (GntR family)